MSEPGFGRWAADSSNLVQSARLFARITSGPEELQAKAAYSRARALAELIQPGSYINLWRSQREIGLMAATLFEEMADRFPDSDLADDAALHSFEGAAGLPLEVLPYREMRLSEAPAEIAAWAAQHLERSYAGTLTTGGFTYLLATAPPGESVELLLIPTPDGAVQVRAQHRSAGRGDRFRLLRFASAVTVELAP